MKLADYLKTMKNPLKKRTVVFLIKDNKVLLGFKKRGFGKGNFLGIGGKVELDETIKQAATREVKEEINVEIINLKQIGILKFYFPHVKDESWNQQVHVFITNTWNGKEQESEEIRPEWFAKNKIPYNFMWDDARYWLPEILKGKKIEASFIFDEKLKVADWDIKIFQKMLPKIS